MNGRLSAGKIWGFSVGTLGEYFVYYLFFTYFLYYLTDFVGIPAAIAGTIMSIAMVWDALTDPVVGYINDTSKNPKGRRRPMMLKAYIPFVICFLLCFIRPSIEGTALYVYYGFVCLAFWICFTAEQVPFYGLLPEIAHHDEDRMKIRQAMAVIGNAGNLAVSIVPIALSVVIGMGFDETTAWSITMGILGAIGGTGFLATYIVTKGMETPPEKVERPEKGIVKTYAEIIKLKGYMPIVVVYLLSTVFINLIFAAMMYVADGKLGLPSGQQSIVIACYTFAGIFFTPLITIMNKKWGSLKSYNISMIITIILYIIVGIIGINSFGMMVFHGVLTGGSFVLFTAFTYGLFYQVIDVAYLKSSEQVEGSVISFATFGYKVGAAISSFTLGIALTIIGYDGVSEIKDPAILGKLDSLLTFMPAALILICLLLLVFMYPIKGDMYTKILEAKAKKEAGEEYSTEEFKTAI